MFDILCDIFRLICYLCDKLIAFSGIRDSKQYWKSSELGQQRQREHQARRQKT